MTVRVNRLFVFSCALLLMLAQSHPVRCEAEETSASTNREVRYVLSDGRKAIGEILGHTPIQLGRPVTKATSLSAKGPLQTEPESVTIRFSEGPVSEYLWPWFEVARQGADNATLTRDLKITVTDATAKTLLSYRLMGCVPEHWTIGSAGIPGIDGEGSLAGDGAIESIQLRCADVQRLAPGSAAGPQIRNAQAGEEPQPKPRLFKTKR